MGSPLRSVEVVTRENLSEMGLTQASKFGFMIETCILAARNDECLVCPAHKEHHLTIRDIAPDLVSTLTHPLKKWFICCLVLDWIITHYKIVWRTAV